MAINRALQAFLVLTAVAAATPAAAQTIYPITRAEILAGAKFDLKVEFPGAVAASDIKVTVNGRDAAAGVRQGRDGGRPTRRGWATPPIGSATSPSSSPAPTR